MKKLISVTLAISILFLLVGCGKTEPEITLPDYAEDALTENPDELITSESSNVNKENVIGTESAGNMHGGINFNFETKTVMLNSGYEMPIYGIGTYSLLDEVCVDSVSAALERGVRMIDTAYMYHNDVMCCEV